MAESTKLDSNLEKEISVGAIKLDAITKARFATAVRNTISDIKSGRISPSEGRSRLEKLANAEEQFMPALSSKAEVQPDLLATVPREKSFFEKRLEAWKSTLSNKEEDTELTEEETNPDVGDVFREALLAYAASLSYDLLDLREKLQDIADLDTVEDMMDAVQSLRDALPDYLKDLNEQLSGVDGIEDALATSFYNGASEAGGGRKFSTVSASVAMAAAGAMLGGLSEEDKDIADRADYVAKGINTGVIQGVADHLDSLIEDEKVTADKVKEAVTQKSQDLDFNPDKPTEGLGADDGLVGDLGINLEMAYGFGGYVGDDDDSPAQEFYREYERKEWRDWPTRWAEAGGQFFEGAATYPQGRMIALVNDPIWYDISAFAQPFPPFDYNSGMGLRPISKEEAVSLGLMEEGDDVQAPTPGFNDNLLFGLDEYSDDIKSQFLKDLGGDFREEGGDARIQNMGGMGSGNWGHAGRPGHKGGSSPKKDPVVHGTYADHLKKLFGDKASKIAPPPHTEEGEDTPFKEEDYKEKWQPAKKWNSAGGVVFNEEGKIALIKPKGQYGGYEYTFPKGTLEKDEQPEDAAHREVLEESGLKGEIKAHLGQHEGSSSFTDYYLMKHTGTDETKMDKETSKVQWVTPEEAANHLHTVRDLRVLIRAMSALKEHHKVQNSAPVVEPVIRNDTPEEPKEEPVPDPDDVPEVDEDETPEWLQELVDK